jgi:hypothetical protein
VNVFQITVMVATLVITMSALIYARKATRQNGELLGMAQRSSQLNGQMFPRFTFTPSNDGTLASVQTHSYGAPSPQMIMLISYRQHLYIGSTPLGRNAAESSNLNPFRLITIERRDDSPTPVALAARNPINEWWDITQYESQLQSRISGTIEDWLRKALVSLVSLAVDCDGLTITVGLDNVSIKPK